MLVPIFFHTVVAVYTKEWYFAQDLLVIYVVIFLGYFQFTNYLSQRAVPPTVHLWAWFTIGVFTSFN